MKKTIWIFFLYSILPPSIAFSTKNKEGIFDIESKYNKLTTELKDQKKTKTPLESKNKAAKEILSEFQEWIKKEKQILHKKADDGEKIDPSRDLLLISLTENWELIPQIPDKKTCTERQNKLQFIANPRYEGKAPDSHYPMPLLWVKKLIEIQCDM